MHLGCRTKDFRGLGLRIEVMVAGGRWKRSDLGEGTCYSCEGKWRGGVKMVIGIGCVGGLDMFVELKQ